MVRFEVRIRQTKREAKKLAIIFEPDPYKFFFKNFAGQFLQTIATLGLTDFVAEDNKGWAYYLGAGLGGAAIATGQVQAIATVYVVGSALDATFLLHRKGATSTYFLTVCCMAHSRHLQVQTHGHRLPLRWQMNSSTALTL